MTDRPDGADDPVAPDPETDPDAAQTEDRPGFFGRIFDALTPGETAQPSGDDDAPSPRTNTPGIGNLRNMRVEEVAIPRADIVSVPLFTTRDELVETFRDSGLTRLPVFDGTLDTPVGFAHLKDFALRHGFGQTEPGDGSFDLQGLVRELLFVPPSMPIGILLAKMQTERIHMALVIDEYGGTDGLVTLEDLVEQVIGEIEDEHDIEEGEFWTVEGAGCYLAEAKTPLGDFESEIGQPLTGPEEVDPEDVDTLGGLVFKLAGHVPARGEVIPHPDGPEFEVIEADPRRIKRLRVRLKGSGRIG